MVKKINCQCPKCCTIINLEVEVKKKVSPNGSPCISHLCQRGPPGDRGVKGSIGSKGPKGPPGSKGSIGPQGNQGIPGMMGYQGPMGLQGATGNTGVTGPTGRGNKWYIGMGCGSPTGTSDTPIMGDYLLNLENCEICQYVSGGWTGTGQILNCLTCDDVNNCLKSFPKVDPLTEGNCSTTLILNNSASIFQPGNVIVTQLVIADQIQTTPIGHFDTPTELAALLQPYGWGHMTVAQTNIYLLQLVIAGPVTGTSSYISFSNGDTFNLNLFCDCPEGTCYPCDDFGPESQVLTCKAGAVLWTNAGCLGLTGNTGATGLQGEIGPSGIDGPRGYQGIQGPTGVMECDLIFEALRDKVPDPSMENCQFCGLFDRNAFLFLDPVTQPYFIATAYDSPGNLISPLVPFSNDAEYQTALITLSISVVDNLLKVFSSPSPINRVYYFNGGMNLIASVTLFPTKCCPTGLDANNSVLTKLHAGETGERLAWVPAHCLVDSRINLANEVMKLDDCQKYRCCLFFDVTQPFLGNNPALFPYPWEFTQVILFGMDVSGDYSGDINNFNDMALILQANNWQPIFPGSPIHRYCISSNTPIVDTTASVVISDNNGVTFYCQNEDGLRLDCTTLDDLGPKDLKMVFKTPQGVVLGDPTKILDSFDVCETVTFICQTTFAIDCVISDLGGLGSPGPWRISEMVVGDLNQTVLNDKFSDRDQLRNILINMGWDDQGQWVMSLSQSLAEPGNNSYVVIQDADLNTHQIVLPINCTPDCGGNGNRLVLTKDDECNYCWLAPECLRTNNITNVISCCTGCTGCTGQSCILDEIPYCEIDPKFDLKLILRKSIVDLIKSHFNSNGPFWLVGYKLENGDLLTLNEPIPQPLNLHNLAATLSNLEPQWVSKPNLIDIDDQTTEVCMTLPNSCELITGICINLVGRDGLLPPFNYTISIDDIIGQSCPGLSKDAQVLIKDGTGFCFVDVECFMPIIPPPPNFPKELCGLDECPDEITYKICIRFDDCDVVKLKDIYGSTQSIEIVEYQLVDGPPVCVNKNIGSCPTVEDLIDAFYDIGWTSPIVIARPVTLELITELNINYVVLNAVGANPNHVPYPYLVPASCTKDSNCPSNDPLNKTLIKRPDGHVCWTQICPVRGPKGPTGFTGPTGYTGATGFRGFQGVQGDSGVLGPQGDQGFQGSPGVTGTQGPTGPQGMTGMMGSQGVTGTQGFRGFQGAPGAMGTMGAQGYQGETGVVGATGPQGVTGPQGLTGPDGPVGPDGATGPQGFQGLRGFQGGSGPVGPTGPQGFQGNIGSVGPVGPIGIQGDIGSVGGVGPAGPPGPQGFQGTEEPINGDNDGSGADVFISKSGSNLQFRRLNDDENINITQNASDIDIAVQDSFNWGNTVFSGGSSSNSGAATVSSGSSLTFNSGSVLYTDEIEETTSTAGVTIDTSNDGSGSILNPAGVLVKDGGVRFENRIDGSNVTTRTSFLEFYEFGTFMVDWKASPGSGVSTSNYVIEFQRIGNIVTIYLDSSLSGSITGVGSPIVTTGFPTRLLPNTDQDYIFIYEDSGRTVGILTITSSSTNTIEVYKNLDKDNFTGSDSFTYTAGVNAAVALTYLIF